jgi:uncharacterized protein YbjT (DUF2867 family)
VKIIVVGGSGLIGSKLVSSVRRDGGVRGNGYTVLPASPSTGVDAITGAGLARVFAGAQVVVDVANSPSFEDHAVLKFFETAGRNLMAAEAAAGVRHHVALSMVGIDRNPEVGYFRAKMAQESLIKASGIPYTIVRSTQFFEFVASIAQASDVGETVHASPALVQPIAADDVVAVLADFARGAPMNDTVEVAGPERSPLDEVVLKYLISHHDRRRVISDVHACYFGLELNDKSLTPGDKPRIGPTHFEDWLRSEV